jgi:ring-1,2-phenylacetyl-CoA epoxidase subunit PaaE
MSRFHALKIAGIRAETPDSVSISLDIPDDLKAEFAFEPGQYLTLRTTLDGEEIRRAYSICSTPDEATLRVGVKKVSGGAFSTFANENLRPGDVVEAMPPEGRFTHRKAGARHVLAIAAGSGITPILSIIKTLLARDPDVAVTLIYGNRTSATVMFAEEIEDLKNRYLDRLAVVHILSREAQDVPLLSGRITADRIRALATGVVDLTGIDEAFLCGPESMVTEARSALGALGVAADAIRAELFTAAPPRKTYRAPASTEVGADRLATVTVTLDGKRHRFEMLASDENLIDAAARTGLDLPYSCKGGMCCTCRCRVTEGAVDMAVNYSLEEWETKSGFVLGCQSRPTTPGIAIDFDQL